MAYFNHAFSKMFLGTGSTLPDPLVTPIAVDTDNGFLTQVGVTTAQLSELPVGYFGFFDAKTYLSLGDSYSSPDCCPVILASSAIIQVDKIGPFHGGYRETNKSKVINPKYVQKIYRVDACEPKQAVVSVGNTPQTAGPTDPLNFQGGTTAATCCFEFLCGETYYLRVDVKGSPALRLLDHNSYLTLEGYTGCCADDTIAPVPVDPRIVFIQWAKQLRNSKLMNQFVFPVVTYKDGAGNWTYYYPDDIATLPVIPGVTVQRWNQFVDNGYQAGECAGMVLIGAYEETKFGTCTFQISDFYELEPIRIYASEVDLTGSPCEFNGLCVGVQCYGKQANGIGETVVRDVILSEAYRQNFFHSDFRIREITQGYDLYTNAGLSRTSYYDRIFIQHSVPRFYNPTGTFDNDQYIVEIITPANALLNGTLNANTQALLNNIQFWVEQQCGGKCVVESTGASSNCPTSNPAVPLPAVPYPVGL